jgi:hypothetical protein
LKRIRETVDDLENELKSEPEEYQRNVDTVNEDRRG